MNPHGIQTPRSVEPLTEEPASTVTALAQDSEKEGTLQVPHKELVAYSLAGAGEGMASSIFGALTMPILNIFLGINPGLISTILSIRGILDACCDPIIGHASDNFRSKWGRRRPFILVGGLISGGLLSAIWCFNPSWSHHAILAWFLSLYLLFSIGYSLFSVGYFALGIELAPNYHERTRVVAYRSVVSKPFSLLTMWFYSFALLPIFSNELVGARCLAVATSLIVICTCTMTFLGTRERTKFVVGKKKENLLHALKSTYTNPEFLRVTAIYVVMNTSLSLFGIFGTFVNIFYVFGGNKTAGAAMSATAGTIGWVCAWFSIPLVTWFSKRFQKHNTLRFTLALMVAGGILKFWCFNPKYPYLQLVLPFFFSTGIAGVYTVLSSMQADVVDLDELRSGYRREGIFGAAGGWVMKSAGALAGVLSGVMLNLTGYDVALGGHQNPRTYFWMLFLFSFGTAAMNAFCFLLLWNYPLTERRMAEIRAELDRRHAQENND